MDRDSGKWMLKFDLDIEINDFDFDMQGRLLLIGTSDPVTAKFRALVERVQADQKKTEILHPYPEKANDAWFAEFNPCIPAAGALVCNYESVQIGEFIVLFNSIARRVFVLNAYDGVFREASLGLPIRAYADIVAKSKENPNRFEDLCWQVLPKTDTEAWIVLPGGGALNSAAKEKIILRAITLDLHEGTCGDPVDLPGLHLPVFFNPSGRLVNLQVALDEFATARVSAPTGAILTRPLPSTPEAR